MKQLLLIHDVLVPSLLWPSLTLSSPCPISRVRREYTELHKDTSSLWSAFRAAMFFLLSLQSFRQRDSVFFLYFML